jgi:hypothetical protein
LELYLGKFQKRDTKILNSLKNAQTLEELTAQALIYGRFLDPKEFFIAAERIMLEKHLKILLDTKQIEYSDGKYKLI